MNGRFPLLLALTLLSACDDNPANPPFGGLAITTSTPARQGLTTADGWNLQIDHYLVHVSAVNVAGDDHVLAASATPQIIDQATPASKSLLEARARTARAWEDVDLRIGPPAAGTETTVVDPVTEADRETMQKDRLSIYVEGKASKAGDVKSFKWGFSTDTVYDKCQSTKNGAVVRGLVVPPGGMGAANVVMDPAVLFSDDLGMAGTLRASAIAAADADKDGVVTMAELRATTLDAARAAGGPYGIGESANIADLGAFVEALTRRTVTSFQDGGTCVPEPAAAP